MDSLAQEMSPKLSAHSDSILLNKDLFHRVKSVYEKRKSLNLNPEQTRLIEETHKYFVRAGVQLDGKFHGKIDCDQPRTVLTLSPV